VQLFRSRGRKTAISSSEGQKQLARMASMDAEKHKELKRAERKATKAAASRNRQRNETQLGKRTLYSSTLRHATQSSINNE